MNNQWFSKIAVWLVIALVLFTVFKSFNNGQTQTGRVDYSEFLESVRNKQVARAEIQEGINSVEIVANMTDGKQVHTTGMVDDRGLTKDLIDNNVKFSVKQREEQGMLTTLLLSWAPMLLLIGVWVYFMRQMQGGGKGGAFSFGKSKARMLDEANNTVTFADVAEIGRAHV